MISQICAHLVSTYGLMKVFSILHSFCQKFLLKKHGVLARAEGITSVCHENKNRKSMKPPNN